MNTNDEKMSNGVKKINRKFSGFNITLGALLLLAIAFSVIKIVMATAPNPGHAWADIDSVALTVGQGGTGATTLTGVIIGNGTNAFTVKTNPSGAFVGDTDSQTLTGKTYNGLTLATQAGGFTIAGGTTPKTLTVTGDATISGSPLADPMTTRGDIIIRNASNATARLGIGTVNYVLGSDGTDITWHAITGTGNVVRASSPTIVTPTIASFTNATHNHQAAAGGGTLTEAALALTDVSTGNVSISAHGFVPKAPNLTTQFLRGDATWAAPPAGGGATYVVTTADSSSAAVTTYANITGLSWTVNASTRYDVTCNIIYNASATTIGLGIGWTGPASPTRTHGLMVAGLSGGVTVGGTASVGNDTGGVTASSVYTASNTATFEGVWENGSTGGTLQMRFKPETATANGTVIKIGSWCKYSTY